MFLSLRRTPVSYPGGRQRGRSTLVAGLMKDNGKDPQVAALNGIVLLNNDHPGDAVIALEGAASNARRRIHFNSGWAGPHWQRRQQSGREEFSPGAQLNPPGLEALSQLAIIAARRGHEHADRSADKTIAAAPHFYRGYLWRATSS